MEIESFSENVHVNDVVFSHVEETEKMENLFWGSQSLKRNRSFTKQVCVKN